MKNKYYSTYEIGTVEYIQIIKENPTITAKEISMKIGNRGLPAIKYG